ncbi:MAG: pantoate--beta-alanine ligase [bacterium P3]|nr:MAG: pantoate--beta-alanine ligase [bacterium P3]KWW40431.1 MAG: pantoate--beta-alanine ligase [bacterium F083]
MQQITSAAALTERTAASKRQGCTVGLVPTMGALHEGHLSLVRRALDENDLVVVSLFVNPIQFNNREDLEKYPRTLDADLKLIASLPQRDGQLLAFTPSVAEMYPEPTDGVVYDLGPVADVMEGPRRPGHFNGVAIVVRRLFDLTQPTRAYFGEKDFQQVAVIRSLLRITGHPVELVPCPIVRAADGLALSSRNARLSAEARAMAPMIYDTLSQAVEMSEYEDVDTVRLWVLDTLSSAHEVFPQPGGLHFEPEYFEVVDDTTLQPISRWRDAKGSVGCIAVWLDGVRLIDMVRFR